MKNLYGSGLAALLCMSVMALVGCSAGSRLEQEPVSAPNKVTPKITITTESTSDSVAKPATTELTNTELKPRGTDSCTDDFGCTVVPQPPSNCLPCLKSGGQIPVSKEHAKQIMGPEKGKCKPMIDALRKQGQGQNGGQEMVRSQDESCSFNAAKCIEGTCQLVELSEQELQQRHQAMMRGQQGAPASGAFAPQAPNPFPQNAGINQGFPGMDPRLGANSDPSLQPSLSLPQGYGRNTSYPGWGNNLGNSPFNRNNFGSFPGMSSGVGGNPQAFNGFRGDAANYPGSFPGMTSGAGGAGDYRGSFPGMGSGSAGNYPGSFPGMGAPGAAGYPGASHSAMSPRSGF